ncbi:hypothetical protein ACF07Y_45920 [Streptomyces sp. NPDC016566]
MPSRSQPAHLVCSSSRPATELRIQLAYGKAHGTGIALALDRA